MIIWLNLAPRRMPIWNPVRGAVFRISGILSADSIGIRNAHILLRLESNLGVSA
jgi:hypothetical protein